MDQQRWAGALGALENGLQVADQTEDKIRFLEGLAFIYAEEERGSQALRSIEQALSLARMEPGPITSAAEPWPCWGACRKHVRRHCKCFPSSRTTRMPVGPWI